MSGVLAKKEVLFILLSTLLFSIALWEGETRDISCICTFYRGASF